MISSVAMLAPVAWRNLWRNPRRTLITLMVVAVGMWSILMFDVMLKAWADSSRQASLRLLTGEGQIHAAGYLDDPDVAHRMLGPTGELAKVLASPLVGEWAARVRVPAVVQSEYRTRPITLLGVSPGAERRISDLPSEVVAGRYLTGEGDPGLVIGEDLAGKLKTRLGKRVILMAQAADGRLAETSYTIVGLFSGAQAAQDEFAFSGVSTVQRQLGMDHDISEISFDAAPKGQLADLVVAIRKASPAADVQPWTALSPLAYTMETVSRTFIGIWLMIMVVLMAIGIVNTQLMAVFERTRELGLLQALGMRPGLVTLQVALESAALVAIGVVAGAILMLVSLAPFVRGLDLGFLAAGAEMFGAERVLYPKFDPQDAALFGVVVWLLGMGAALWPAWSAARIDPVVAMGQL